MLHTTLRQIGIISRPTILAISLSLGAMTAFTSALSLNLLTYILIFLIRLPVGLILILLTTLSFSIFFVVETISVVIAFPFMALFISRNALNKCWINNYPISIKKFFSMENSKYLTRIKMMGIKKAEMISPPGGLRIIRNIFSWILKD